MHFLLPTAPFGRAHEVFGQNALTLENVQALILKTENLWAQEGGRIKASTLNQAERRLPRMPWTLYTFTPVTETATAQRIESCFVHILKDSTVPTRRGTRSVYLDAERGILLVGTTVFYSDNWAATDVQDPVVEATVDALQRWSRLCNTDQDISGRTAKPMTVQAARENIDVEGTEKKAWRIQWSDTTAIEGLPTCSRDWNNLFEHARPAQRGLFCVTLQETPPPHAVQAQISLWKHDLTRAQKAAGGAGTAWTERDRQFLSALFLGWMERAPGSVLNLWCTVYPAGIIEGAYASNDDDLDLQGREAEGAYRRWTDWMTTQVVCAKRLLNLN